MTISLNELQMYKDFDELAVDILQMANEFMPDKMIYLTTLTEKQQIVMKVKDNHINLDINEGLTVDRSEAACNWIDFKTGVPLIFEDVAKENDRTELRDILLNANIHSYLGVPITLSDGQTFGTLCAVHPAPTKFNSQSIKMFQTIAKMFSYYLDLERMAYRDSLTGLYNRQFLYKYFDDFSKNGGALFFLDMDGFKKVNDMHGHEMGDLVIKEVALRLGEHMKQQSGFAVRLGGDEFVININERKDIQDVKMQAETLLARFSTWDTHLEEFHLSVSIGIALYLPGDDLKTLLKNADNALYRAKAKGKNTYRFF